jgi:DNA-binding transcriptional MerR regulator
MSGIKTYTISQACKELGIAPHKLRYIEEAVEYDVGRDSFNNRIYNDADISNIKEFMRLKEKQKLSYIAIKENFYDKVKNSPIDEEELMKEVSVEETILTMPKDIGAMHDFMAKIERFQTTLDIVIDKLDKVDRLDEKLEKLEKLNDLDNFKDEIRGFLGESRNLIESANREAEERDKLMVTNMKEILAARKEQAEKEEKKGFLKKIFG